MSPRISIITPAYNAEPYIAEAIESVIAQTFTDWEMLIGDDCSTDGTLAVCRSFAERDRRIRVISLASHHGEANGVRQELMAHAVGEWVHELDADDTIASDVLQSLLSLAESTGADAVTQRSVCMTEAGEPLNESIPAEGFDYDRVLTGMEACRLTIPGWRINMNGGLFRPALLRAAEEERRAFVAQVLPQSPCPPDADAAAAGKLIYDDELLSRFILKNASRVAFSPAIYWRREASTSITRQYGIRLFDHVRVQWLVKRFAGRFSPDLVDAAELNLWWKITAHACQYEYHRRSLPSADRDRLNHLIRSYWTAIDNRRVRPQLPLWRRWTMTYAYPVFRTFITLRCLVR